jgi:hypothetical protein
MYIICQKKRKNIVCPWIYIRLNFIFTLYFSTFLYLALLGLTGKIERIAMDHPEVYFKNMWGDVNHSYAFTMLCTYQ